MTSTHQAKAHSEENDAVAVLLGRAIDDARSASFRLPSDGAMRRASEVLSAVQQQCPGILSETWVVIGEDGEIEIEISSSDSPTELTLFIRDGGAEINLVTAESASGGIRGSRATLGEVLEHLAAA